MTQPINCVVFFSGGAASWAAGKLAVEKYGRDKTTLLFTDTLIEDADLYRFLDEAAANIDAPLVRLADGRTPWQIFRDEKIIGNSRIDPCSKILKRKLSERWLKENRDPATTALVFGIDWTEKHRFDDGEGRGVKNRYARLGWPHVEALLTLSPLMAKWDVMAWLKREGLQRPRLYDLGFAHNNCGGACVKAGKGHWAHLLRTLPAIYADWEREEEAFNDSRPERRPQTILRDQFDDDRPTLPVSLREFRRRIEAGAQIDMFDVGGCDCFFPEQEAAE
ncbi:phosphoadenosine phosphosulfate reductase family protein [Bradyrhizobium phage ppBeUSDA76-2]|uniref:phosphoadenosine phosphosulfate reductase domain-containing protein n=3 Tax=Bradyrhizobium TaxID=374 RepID=UPI00037E157F|nr:phosphoadenosine phosphosulfate reductase family protein [Bradyrhizobium elkanii]WAX24376.1 phosphoadenosine phosphosulfate reductase family protein [Bradyrhizobium phage ppBeUSDA76-2]MCP1732473.1 3'-phosphoadenosine 5'-phosphosulfate sulfotransferase (PAPS reductase)/FAD synthetase [Bradyrhizobium elkanii]MCS3567811.1 3'-phosphoadenosine 5'-phosphosulfate sulfotransferase (PAPS reductase)/FAD synthetase [Bradyrhizobium elkanii]MCS3590706.1 3'-phosphoadenosine 5'-phosphosulfate sulfotransfer